MHDTLIRRARAKSKSLSVSGRSASYGGISSDAVKTATGKGWNAWLRIMDRGGCAKMDHKQIVGPGWQQMVTVGYEQARGMRDKHEKATGYSVSASKTLKTSAAGAFLWWKMDRCRVQWLGDADVKVHKATPSKSLRATWNANSAKPFKSISVNLYAKGTDRTTMTIQHEKLASAAEAKKMKAYWGARLGRLERLIAEQSNGR